MSKKVVYIIGSKGIPAKYGGFETFVEKLTEYQKSKFIKYYVACMKENSIKSNYFEQMFEYNRATCFNISVPQIGPARAIYYDIRALERAISVAKKNRDEEPIFYVLACRIGPFVGYFKKKIEKIGGTLLVNPDGHEWMREKWSIPVRKYWKFSEQLMVKHSDLLICDSKNIEKYIQNVYSNYAPKTTYLAYGTDLERSKLASEDYEVRDWYFSKKISENKYYLVVGRFVPENNYKSIIKGFMDSNTNKDLVIITNVEQNDFYKNLKKETNFDTDNRIKFVGTVYNQELLKYIRENAFAYIHGHEVGGTNPSLLEALSATRLNLLLNVGFNKEVGLDSSLYWDKSNLKQIIENAEKLSCDQINQFDKNSSAEVKKRFSWTFIVSEYEKLFLKKNN